MLELINLSKQIGMYEERLLKHCNWSDSFNYNEEKSNLIKSKINHLRERHYFLKKKWFEN